MKRKENTFIIGIDVGTQSAKVKIFDLSGQIVASSQKKLQPLSIPGPLLALHPGDDVWESLDRAIKDAVENFRQHKDFQIKDIKAVGLCTIRCCRVLLKKDGSLSYPIMSWMDKRLNTPYQWQEDFGDVAYVCSSSGYITHRLTGEFKDTCANYIGCWPIDDACGDWSTDKNYLSSMGLERSMLFDLVKPGERLGTLRGDLANKYGLSSNIPVVASAHDKAVEALGAGSLDKSSLLISLGTYIGAMTHADKKLSDSKKCWAFPASIPGKFLYECMGVRRGMWTVSWFCEQFGEGLVSKLQDQNISIEEYFNREASSIPPGSEGLLTIHDWAPPADALYRKGLMIGFDGRHTKFHIYRSILEGIAFTMKNHVDEMSDELALRTKRIILSGGGAQSDLFCQIFADVFCLEVARNKLTCSASLGAAMNAAVMMGIYDNYDDASSSMIEVEKVFLPDVKNHEIYRELNQNVYKHAHSNIDPLLKKLSPLSDRE